jgi:hypothetical protein
MWVLNGDCSNIIRDGEPFFGSDGTHYSPQWDKSAVPGMREVVLTPEPSRPGYRTTGNTVEMIGGVPVRVWLQEPIPNMPSQAEIDAAEEAHRLRTIAALEAELAALRGGPS